MSSNASRARRVVVTGYGALSPLGHSATESWNNLIAGKCGVVKLEGEGYDKLPCRIAARISPPIDLTKHFSKSDLRTMAPATAYSLIAAQEALERAQWLPQSKEERERTGVAVGMGMIDLDDVCETAEALKRSYNRVSPYFVTRILPNMAAGQISIKHSFHGPNHAVSTACATGAHAIGDAFRFIEHGDADVMVCGGAEACISPLSIAAFARMRALSTSFNDCPEAASRPFEKNRDGFVMGEGAAILILEELQHAVARGAKIYGEMLGYGLSGDASHLTSPSDSGTGAVLSMTRALQSANIDITQVGYINAHATSTPLGDAIESKAIHTVFGEHSKNLAVSSTKGAHGHLLGSAGNLETLFTILACDTGLIPATINHTESDIDLQLNYVPNTSQKWNHDSNAQRIALKNAFGFGGTNATLCISQYKNNV
ncbi:3-oxoacyl-[acyl-carrier-protein] synthase, mitochondrial [Frankliniella fusca]|uniref:3-oxoacyl-[acyl-carrier-protein] synthase n=1 Tax=Frankliniella fusca TaxID=407009 RepID=A0AAE1LKY3_9NEOP|nr:3-oxoacyl-[acyl-carrier-protein] synthase, mitochondrial [Frankliniella fusca]